MTGSDRAERAVLWLTAQAGAFGVMAALLGIVANAMFLDAYGSEWLPATYIAIGVAGILVSGAVARSARSADLVRIALVVLGGAAVIVTLAWSIAALAGGAWVSVPLLVLFPILIQLGFVFIGAQAGRLLDIAGIKATFPRIVAGFPAGAVLGGLLGGWLVAWSGRTEDLLVATAIAQAAFAALVWMTGRRYASRLGRTDDGAANVVDAGSAAEPVERPSMRELLGRPYVGLILAYQVLSALASQLADFLVFDRAAALYPASADLAGFLAGYTAVMNVVSIVFLFALAGPLLRRFGLRLGIAANPLVLTAFAMAMLVANASAGAASVTLLVVVAAARIADIALTDGTTRTSINAAYQALPERSRLAVQATVEGIGVPVAIGVSGVLIIVLGALPSALEATILVTLITCIVWTWSAVLLYRAYGPALVDALRRRRWLDFDAALEATAADAGVIGRLVRTTDPRAARLAFDMLGGQSNEPTLTVDLAALSDDGRPAVRMAALVGLATTGDVAARERLANEVREAAASDDPAMRLRAAHALEALDVVDREAAAFLLDDGDEAIRCAALDAVRPGDQFAVDRVVAALDDPRTVGPAAAAVARLGDAVLPILARELERSAGLAAAGIPTRPTVLRLVRAAATRTPMRDDMLRLHVGHPDRELGLVVMQRLVAPGAAAGAVGDALDEVLAEDARHAVRIVAAGLALNGDVGSPDGDGPLRRALDDDWDLVRRRVAAGRLARHGSASLGPALARLSTGGPGVAIAVEALDVLLEPAERDSVLPMLRPDLALAERIARLPATAVESSNAAASVRDMVEDPDGRWRSPWLRACAIHAAAARGILDGMNLASARALGDPVVDEELDLAATA